jgi:uncharacterized protein YjiS (DUF1127 family)
MTTITEPKARSHPSFWASVGAVIVHPVMALLAWHEPTRQRRQLLSLSDYALKDIGKSRDDVASSLSRAVWIMGEGDQPCWRASINWIGRQPR